WAGELLNIKPILSIDDGEVLPVKRVRGNRKAFLEFATAFEAGTADRPSLRVGIAHGEAPVDSLSGVGPTLDKRLAKLGLRTLRDLLEHRPHRYEAAVPERRIADLLAEEEAAIAGEVRSVSVRRPRRNLAIVNARVGDESGEIVA